LLLRSNDRGEERRDARDRQAPHYTHRDACAAQSSMTELASASAGRPEAGRTPAWSIADVFT
jgi:hypothetical protein